MPLLALIGFGGQSGVCAQTDSLSLRYPIPDMPSHGESYPASPINLAEPDNVEYSAVYDALSGTVTIYRKIGGMNVRLPYTMTLEEYQNDRTRRSMLEYWLQRSNEESRAMRNANSDGDEADEANNNSILNSKWRINSDLFASIFGSNQITMKLQGQAKVSLGVQVNKIDNPTMQERMRKTTSFDFNQSVQMNLNSQIGERMKLGINYNTEATFDFENEVKLNYTGTEDDIIQNIEAGNITWSLPGTLMQGSQSLFGFKMDMKFGRLKVSTVFSQKKGETQSMTIQGGATKKDFDIDITDYERNRHFFLAHYFKDMYDNALRSLPNVNSPITINKIEVWVTNRTGSYNNTRNILAFTDIAENKKSDLQSPSQWNVSNSPVPSNDANDLYVKLTSSIIPSRSINDFTAAMSSYSNIRPARDYEKME
ncbi:MAG: cell surface protein SprA, partial [Bacteroidales bacterium]|nr:cell surface protein SprA [Bacteroidales bacterium]